MNFRKGLKATLVCLGVLSTYQIVAQEAKVSVDQNLLKEVKLLETEVEKSSIFSTDLEHIKSELQRVEKRILDLKLQMRADRGGDPGP